MVLFVTIDLSIRFNDFMLCKNFGTLIYYLHRSVAITVYKDINFESTYKVATILLNYILAEYS